MTFPEDFLWGVSESGFQFEMGDKEGKNIDPNTDWFVWVHDRENIESGLVSGDFPEHGIDYWSRYRKDHELASDLGLNAYRIGIEWSRIFPYSTYMVDVDVERSSDGTIKRIKLDERDMEMLDGLADKKAINKYRSIIEDLKSRGFYVIVNLNHFTLPLWIHDPIAVRRTRFRKGPLGWLDERTIVEFAKYSAYIAMKIGDLVDHWSTFCEPMIVSEAGYLQIGGFPPYILTWGSPPRAWRSAFAKVVKNMIIAHSRAYDAIKEWDRVKAYDESISPAIVGIIKNVQPIEPLRDDKETDVKAASFVNYLHNHFFIQAITSGWLDENFNGAKKGNEMRSHLANHLDWLGINYYTRLVVRGKLRLLAKLSLGIPIFFEIVPGYGILGGMRKMVGNFHSRGSKNIVNKTSLDGHPVSDFGWEVYPEGIGKVIELMKIYKLPMFITEHGIADSRDRLRSWLITTHLKILEEKIEEGMDLRGYFHWALTDNYEWTRGFKMKFGLFHVDLNSKERIPRRSAKIYREVIDHNGVTKEIVEKTSFH